MSRQSLRVKETEMKAWEEKKKWEKSAQRQSPGNLQRAFLNIQLSIPQTTNERKLTKARPEQVDGLGLECWFIQSQ